nr:hypothetical protein Iba_chr01dCG13310 [Ipomoea batatas]
MLLSAELKPYTQLHLFVPAKVWCFVDEDEVEAIGPREEQNYKKLPLAFKNLALEKNMDPLCPFIRCAPKV